jgi:hypothetical protein
MKFSLFFELSCPTCFRQTYVREDINYNPLFSVAAHNMPSTKNFTTAKAKKNKKKYAHYTRIYP